MHSALNQLDPSKTTSIDTISPKALKHCTCASSLTRPLCHLFNLSLSTGVIPQEWKVHLVVPVYKSSDQSSVKNYRPISLLCNTSKVLETLIYNSIIIFIYLIILLQANLDFCLAGPLLSSFYYI